MRTILAAALVGQSIALRAMAAAPSAPVAQLCADGSICFELLKGMPTAVIALIVAGIALRQYRVARAKLKLDLFEKRYAIFLETWKILSETVRSGTLQQQTGLGTPFNNFIPQAAFLFGPEVEAYLNKAVKNWALLRALQSKSERGTGATAPSDSAQRIELEQWFFHEADKNAKKLFGKYLGFEAWH